MKNLNVIVRVAQRASKSYLMTIPNTENGRALLKTIRAKFKLEGKPLRVYGRGSGKASCLATIKDDPNCWEAIAMRINPECKPWNRMFYRPKMKYAERFDVYFR